MITQGSFLKILALIIVFFITSSAQAALVNFNVTGAVGSGSTYFESFGGDIYALGSFDNTGFTGIGNESFQTSLSVEIGAVSFTEAEFAFADTIGNTTEITFVNGVFQGFEAFVFTSDNAFSLSLFGDSFQGEAWDIEGTSLDIMDGVWVSNSYTVVPIPASLWLFGAGLISLSGFIRRRKI